MATINMVQNDTAPSIPITIKRLGGTAVDLTGATVRFKIKNNDTGLRSNDAANTCTINSATGGQVTYNFSANDLSAATSYNCDVEITYGTGKVETAFEVVTIIARPEA